MFYFNNYIDWDQFNQLCDPDWLEKDIQSADAVGLNKSNKYKVGSCQRGGLKKATGD